MAARVIPENTDTRTAILDVAERLVQTRGFNGFSYADVASELGLTKAALHYHFAGKGELGEALVARYADRFMQQLTALDASGTSSFARLTGYTRLYRAVVAEGRMCLCGMLAAEYQTLPEGMRRAVVDFLDANLEWVGRLLEAGRADGTVSFDGRAEDAAQMIIGALEGAMLVTRPYADGRRFEAAAAQLLSEFGQAGGTRRAR